MIVPAPRQAGVTVLLATYNGMKWLPEQLASILQQEGVDLSLVVLDDESTDGTRQWLVDQAADDPRISVLPSIGSSGGSAANFFRMIGLVSPAPDGYLAFADQDDVWVQGKLARHVGILRSGGHDGISSNITAFTTEGRRTLIRKDFPQRRFDYLTESPGPGSTFMITPRLAALVAEQLADPASPAAKADFHDSLIYVIARAAGFSWHIDGMSTVDYRQHESNVMGSNVGVGSALSRFGLIRSHWHRNQAILHATAGLRVASAGVRPELERVLDLFIGGGFARRLALTRMASQLRRRRRDQRIIALLIAIGIW